MLGTYGYAALFLVTVAQCTGLPISSEIVIPFAGVLAADGTLSLSLVILVTVLGELVGALIAYAVGVWVGRPALLTVGAHLRFRERHLHAAERWIERRGVAAIAIGRCIPVVRGYTSFAAGFTRMPISAFLLATLLGAVVWDTALALAGFELGRHSSQALQVLQPIGYVALGLLALVATYAVYRWTKRDG